MPMFPPLFPAKGPALAPAVAPKPKLPKLPGPASPPDELGDLLEPKQEELETPAPAPYEEPKANLNDLLEPEQDELAAPELIDYDTPADDLNALPGTPTPVATPAPTPPVTPTATPATPATPSVPATTTPTSSTQPVPPALTKKQTAEELYGTWEKSQSPEDLQAILDHLASDIDKAIYAHAGLNAGPAIKSKAKLLAIKAIKSYSKDSGASLTSWVHTQLQPLSRYSKDLSPAPVSERTNQQLSALKKQEADFYENTGRAPSDAELADLTGMSLKQIAKLRELDKKTYNESYVPNTGENTTTAQEMTTIQNESFKQDVLDTLYSSLSPQEQYILEHKLGYNGKPIKSNDEIAKDLGISPGRVSQLTKGVSDKLEEYSELNKGSK